ncbi:MAG: hypothetical protein ACYC2R_14310 [Burkholderiales bacterium]
MWRGFLGRWRRFGWWRWNGNLGGNHSFTTRRFGGDNGSWLAPAQNRQHAYRNHHEYDGGDQAAHRAFFDFGLIVNGTVLSFCHASPLFIFVALKMPWLIYRRPGAKVKEGSVDGLFNLLDVVF